MSARTRLLLVIGCLLAALALPGRTGAVSLQPVGTFASPIYISSPRGDSRLFVVERAGTIRVVKNGATLGIPFLDIHTMTTTDGERGLFSIAFDPNYTSNGLFYVFYTGDGTNSGGTLGEAHIDEYHVSANPDVANPASRRQVLLITRPDMTAGNHNGGQLQFGKDGMLYISVGDGGTGGGTAQDNSVLNGKLLRIDPHRSGLTPEIWSSGLRNPWRFSFDHLDGSLLIGDVGQNLHEEIDYQPASTGFGRGANFGWNCREAFSAFIGCSGAFADPIFDYPHSNPGGDAAYGCAITGGYVYRGTAMPGLFGRYLYADLCTSVLRSIQPALPRATGDRGEVVIPGNPVSFGEDSSCRLYVAAGNQVLRVAPDGTVPAARCATRLSLSAKKRRVRRNHRAKLTIVGEPCPDLSGAEVVLQRGKRHRRNVHLDSSCSARLRIRISHRTKLRASLLGNAQLEPAVSDPLRIKIEH